jgi:tRNA modification GTPase
LRAAEADLVLWLIDAEHGQSESTRHQLAADARVWVIRNKIDLEGQGRGADSASDLPGTRSASALRISASRGDGIAELVASLTGFARDYLGSGEEALIGRERQRKLLQETASSLQRSLSAAGQGEELVAEELRRASDFLGRLLGRVDAEDILDAIFREFCIGK